MDGNGRPLPGERLELRVMQSTRDTRFVHSTVTTDESGGFRVEGVEFPCSFHVADRRPGRRIVPSEVEPRVVRDGERVRVVRHDRHRVVVRVPDRDVAARVTETAGRGVVVDVLPLEPGGYPRWDLHDDGNKCLRQEAVRQLAVEGEFDVGDLPGGRYRVTIFVPELGTWSGEVEVDESRGVNVVTVDIRPAGQIEGRLIANGRALAGAFVVDGYVPLTAIRSIFENHGCAGSWASAMRACGVAGEDGSIRLASHNAAESHVTVFVDRARVRHVEKSMLRRGTGFDAADREGIVCGVVLDPHGHPASGIAVNLSSITGGEGHGVAAWPKGVELLDLLTDSAGRFEIEGITPGIYVLSVAEVEYAGSPNERTFRFDARALQVLQVERGRQELRVELEGHGAACDHLHASADSR